MVKKYLVFDYETLDTVLIGEEEDVILEANEYYHNHFDDEEDYDSNFEIDNIQDAIDFWKSNDYGIYERK